MSDTPNTPSAAPEDPIESPADVAAAEKRHDPYAALRSVNYRLFAAGFISSSTGLQMLSTAIGWEIYERTGDALHLGFIGLARAIPVLLLALPGGHAADLYNRQRILSITQAAFALLCAALALCSWLIPQNADPSKQTVFLYLFYAVLVLTGVARAFNGPSRSSLLPMIVGPDEFHNAVTWNSSAFQFSATAGPIVAGLMLAQFKLAWPVYAATAILCAVFAISAIFLKPRERAKPTGKFTIQSMLAGFGHLKKEQSILGAITLDLFAVLLGGATALLPVYAKDILHTGPEWLGVMRAAPFLGALASALVLAHLPPFKKAGQTLLLSVAGFGVCTIIFGWSEVLWLSLLMLFALGVFDGVSVVIRHVLVQVRTPEHLRGRVSAVNSIFIESSNELGAFESGAVAKMFSPVVSVVAGGFGTLAVVAFIAWWLPDLRRLGRLTDVEAKDR